MSDLILDLDELHTRHEKTEEFRLKIFEDILKTCHHKIKKYNTEFKKQDCLFEPPAFIIGKPPYNYVELVDYLIKSLKNNGLRAEWLRSKKAIYVSWRKQDLNMNQYRQQANSTSQPVHQVINPVVPSPFTIMSVRQPEDATTSKKKKGKQTVQHIAMLEYQPGVKDFIPINLKGMK
jgi:hypothetical protein